MQWSARQRGTLYQHSRPDGRECDYLGEIGHTCLHCGTKIERPKPAVASVPKGLFDDGAETETPIVDSKDDLESVSTERIIEVLKARGAEIGEISIGGITGMMVILRDRRKVESG